MLDHVHAMLPPCVHATCLQVCVYSAFRALRCDHVHGMRLHCRHASRMRTLSVPCDVDDDRLPNCRLTMHDDQLWRGLCLTGIAAEHLRQSACGSAQRSMRTRRTRAAAKEEEDAEAAAAVAAVEVAEAVGVPAAALADAAADAAAADGGQPAAHEPAAEPAAADATAADPAAAEPAPDAGAVPIDPGVDAPPPDAGDAAGGFTSAPQQPAADSAAEMAAEPPPGGEEATIPAAKAGEAVPPSEQATGITAITAETAGAAQVRHPAIITTPEPHCATCYPGVCPGGD
jgi:hypothetical protein